MHCHAIHVYSWRRRRWYATSNGTKNEMNRWPMDFFDVHRRTIVWNDSVRVHTIGNRRIIIVWNVDAIRSISVHLMFRCMPIIIVRIRQSYKKVFNDSVPPRIVYLKRVHSLVRRQPISIVVEIIVVIRSRIRLIWVSFFCFFRLIWFSRGQCLKKWFDRSIDLISIDWNNSITDRTTLLYIIIIVKKVN